jgi:hypothetical protein
MFDEIVIDQAESNASAPVTTKPELLRAVVDAVRQDSRTAPEEYLENSTVPHGGE